MLMLMLVVGVVAGATVPATAAAEVDAKPTAGFCRALTIYYTAQFTIALAGASSGGTTGLDPNVLRATWTLAVSPKLVAVTERMRDEGPEILRPELGRQVQLFRQGVEVLKGAGVSQEIVDAIAAARFDGTADPTEQLTKKSGITKERLEAAGAEYEKTLTPAIQAEDTSNPEVAITIESALNDCGVFPDTRVACTDLLSAKQVGDILDADGSLSDEQGCVWEASAAPGDDTSKLGVDVYGSTAAYQAFVKENKKAKRVRGLGDRAVVAEGFSTVAQFSDCGRTVALRDGERAIQIALCVRDHDATTADVVKIAKQVLAAV